MRWIYATSFPPSAPKSRFVSLLVSLVVSLYASLSLRCHFLRSVCRLALGPCRFTLVHHTRTAQDDSTKAAAAASDGPVLPPQLLFIHQVTSPTDLS